MRVILINYLHLLLLQRSVFVFPHRGVSKYPNVNCFCVKMRLTVHCVVEMGSLKSLSDCKCERETEANEQRFHFCFSFLNSNPLELCYFFNYWLNLCCQALINSLFLNLLMRSNLLWAFCVDEVLFAVAAVASVHCRTNKHWKRWWQSPTGSCTFMARSPAAVWPVSRRRIHGGS